MTKEQVIELAKQAGIEFQENTGITGRKKVTTYGSQPIEKIELFIKLARNAALTEAIDKARIFGLGLPIAQIDRLIKALESLKEPTP